MDQDVRDLAIAPFQEIVDKGNVALKNASAGENEQMSKSAKALVREGERALKKLEPLCKKHLEEYSSNFVDALKENDEIAQFRTDLNELLWEFEDYVEVDEFDADKFTELQALSRKAAPRVLDILMRLRLEAPAPSPLSTPNATPIPTLTPPLSHASPNPFDDLTSGRSDVTGPGSHRDSMSPSLGRQSAVDSIVNIKTMMTAESGPDLGLDGGMVVHQTRDESLMLLPTMDSLPQRPETDGGAQRKETEQPPGQHGEQPPPREDEPEVSDVTSIPEEAPPEPESNPWLTECRPSFSNVLPGLNRVGTLERDDTVERRERVPALADSPTLPVKRCVGAQETSIETPPSVQCDVTYTMKPQKSEETLTTDEPSPWTRVISPVEPISGSRVPVPPVKDEPPRRMTSDHDPSAVPRSSHTQHQLQSQRIQTFLQHQPPSHTRDTSSSWSQGYPVSTTTQQYNSPARASTSNNSYHGGRISFGSSGHGSPPHSPINSRGSSHPYFRTPSYEPISPESASYQTPFSPASFSRASTHSTSYDSKHSATSGLVIPEESDAAISENNDYPEVVRDEAEDMPLIDPGLIPVNVENNHVAPPIIPVRSLDCSVGPRSSFHLLKGFCDSAKEMQRGGLGVKQTRKLVYGGGAVIAAKCKNCLYELEWRQVEADRAGSETANYVAQGMGFRLRFLSKSHMASNTVEEQVYGCLFCLQLGRTPDEGDATVFFSQKQLFAHLARHPRPLPTVQGLVVIDGPKIPPAFSNNYDLHFFSPPVVSQLIGIRKELALLPTATATETLKKVHGTIRRPPGDSHEPLQYAEGAKIIGVEFPAKFKGEWAVGWSDGRRSLFPMDTVKLDAPMHNEISLQQTTSLRVVTRWKFAPRDNDGVDWLHFKKGDTISNVSWAYQTHWCWSGTNAKGKWGIFPHSHVDAASLLDISTLPSADAASISSGETQHRSGAGRILSKISLRARGRPPSTVSSSSHETGPVGGGAPLGTVPSASGKPSFY